MYGSALRYHDPANGAISRVETGEQTISLKRASWCGAAFTPTTARQTTWNTFLMPIDHNVRSRGACSDTLLPALTADLHQATDKAESPAYRSTRSTYRKTSRIHNPFAGREGTGEGAPYLNLLHKAGAELVHLDGDAGALAFLALLFTLVGFDAHGLPDVHGVECVSLVQLPQRHSQRDLEGAQCMSGVAEGVRAGKRSSGKTIL